MVYETYEGLIAGVKDKLEEVSKNGVNKQMEEELKRSTDEYFYGQTHVQHSAHHLTQSVDSNFNNKDGNMELSVFHNPEKMQLSYPSWAGNGSSDNRNNIILWLNEGTSGSPIYNHPAYKFIQHGKQQIDNKVIDWYKQELRNRSILVY